MSDPADSAEGKGEPFPIQDGPEISRELAKQVYEGYVIEHGDVQTFERIEERGGFGQWEVKHYLQVALDKAIEDQNRPGKERTG